MVDIAQIILNDPIMRKDVIQHHKSKKDGISVIVTEKKMFGKDVIKIVTSRDLEFWAVDVSIYLYNGNMVFISDIQFVPYDDKIIHLIHREPKSLKEFTKIKTSYIPELIVSTPDMALM